MRASITPRNQIHISASRRKALQGVRTRGCQRHVRRSAESPLKSRNPSTLRREILTVIPGAAIVLLGGSAAAQGWDGPAKFLKSRQQANANKLLAPFEVSLQRLRDAESLLESGHAMGTENPYVAALGAVRRASCNCYEFEAFGSDSFETKISLLTQKLKLADPCTFRIVVKNVTLLSDEMDPVRMEAEAGLQQLVRLYSQLDDALLEASEWQAEEAARDKVVPLIEKTIAQQKGLMASVQRSIDQGLTIG